MPIYTPRGLKIRIDVPYAFGLMARLYPKVTPFKILKTTEGIECLPGMLAFIAGIVGFGLHLSLLQIAILVFVCCVAGASINAFGFYIVPGLVKLSTLYSYLSSYGIYFIVVIVTGVTLEGWQAVLAFFAGRIVAGVVNHILEFRQTSRYHKLIGYPFTSAEVNFFNAYRLHASRIGVTTDINLSDEEEKENHWRDTFEQFATEWPEVVQRFTLD